MPLLPADFDSVRSEAMQLLRQLLQSKQLGRARVQKRAIELLIENEGRLRIADLAMDEKVQWDVDGRDNSVSSLLPSLNKRVQQPWGFGRDDHSIVVTNNGIPVNQ